MSRRIEINEGDMFGNLTVLGEGATLSSGIRVIECKCVCGEIRMVRLSNLRNGHTTGCGCHRPGRRTHGMSGEMEYRVWRGIHDRCNNKNIPPYPYYGGRGIKACDRWGDFMVFFGDMGKSPSRKHSIDRIDNDGDYEPGNCRWATRAEQSRNRRGARSAEIDGELKTVPAWSDISGTKASIIRYRLDHGWSDREAVYGRE